jgi:hypothetical protein
LLVVVEAEVIMVAVVVLEEFVTKKIVKWLLAIILLLWVRVVKGGRNGRVRGQLVETQYLTPLLLWVEGKEVVTLVKLFPPLVVQEREVRLGKG